jgi:hypothetical protein
LNNWKLNLTHCVELKFPVIQQNIIFVKSYNKFKFRGPWQADVIIWVGSTDAGTPVRRICPHHNKCPEKHKT